ncbi:3-oxoacyl-[acyl-carrier-protein] synthase 2 [compost metagenome]
MRNALSDAGVSTDQVDYVCAHGTGTKLNDTTELAALRQVIGGKLPPISSVKSMIGHTLGAAGALGAIACLIGMTEHFLPPTINWNCVDPECGEHDFVTDGARTASPNVIMNNSFGVGGNNAILIFGRESWREQQAEIA